MDDLVDALRSGEVLEPVLAEIEECNAGRGVVADERVGGLGHNDLPAMGGRHQARTSVDFRPVEVPVCAIGIAGVQAHSDSKRSDGSPRRPNKRALRRYRGTHRRCRGWKHREDAVARVADCAPAQDLNRISENAEVLSEGSRHLLRVGFPQASTPLDVGEEEGYGAGRGRACHLRDWAHDSAGLAAAQWMCRAISWASCPTSIAERFWPRSSRRETTMEMRNNSDVLLCTDVTRWESWLADHHNHSSGIWLLIAKKGSDKVSVTISDALDVALCHGWIDSQRKGYDTNYYLQRYSPRRPQSPWSRLNVKRVEALTGADGCGPAAWPKSLPPRRTDVGRPRMNPSPTPGSHRILQPRWNRMSGPELRSNTSTRPINMQLSCPS